MSQQSIIEHKANMYYVEFREDYLAICLGCAYKKATKDGKKSKASPYCKALILAIMEHWTNDKRGKGENLYVFMSYSQWIESMYSMFGRTVVIDSIDELLGEKLISREPYKMFGRDTFKYLLNTKLVNERMKALPDRDPHITRPQVNGSDMGHPSTSNLDPSISKRVTRPLVNGTRPQVNDDPSTSNHNIYSYTESTQILNTESTQENASASDNQPLPSKSSRKNSKKPQETVTQPSLPQEPERQEPALSERAQAVFDEWCKQPWFKGVPPKLTESAINHCEKLAKYETLPTVDEMVKARHWYQKKYPKRQGWYLGNFADAYPQWLSESYQDEQPSTQITNIGSKKPKNNGKATITNMDALYESMSSQEGALAL